MGIKIVTDSSCDLPPALENELRASGVRVIPFLFHFGQETYRDKSMPMGEFLARASQQWPNTAAPPIGAFAEAFREIVREGHHALCITITGRHSATYNSALLAAQEFGPEHVTVVDSGLLSLAQGFLVLAAARAARAGANIREILDKIEELKRRIHFFFALDTLEYLVKGGRASRLVGLIASLLRLRPILTLVEGELTLLEKPRQRSVAIARLLALARAHLPAEILGIMHVDCPSEATELARASSAMSGIPFAEIPIVETGMALATHAGPRALGILVIARP